MAIDLNSIKRTRPNERAPIITLYGPGKIGKTTFATSAPDAIVIRTEDGLTGIEADSFPLAQTYQDVLQALRVLATEEHDFKTLVVDSLDWLEPLIWGHVCQQNGYETIESPGYGRGYTEALDVWREYLRGISFLRDNKGMTIIQIAHDKIKRYDAPESEGYDRYMLKMHDKASALVLEDSDCLFFANYEVLTTSEDKGFGASRSRAVGNGERVLHTQERPAWMAGNRYKMPEKLPLDWAAVSKNIPFFNNTAKKEG